MHHKYSDPDWLQFLCLMMISVHDAIDVIIRWGEYKNVE